jgi:hypothetical protein
VQDGKTLTTDGPFVAVKEALGGYVVFKTDDLDAAIELAARVRAAPHRRCGRGTPGGGAQPAMSRTGAIAGAQVARRTQNLLLCSGFLERASRFLNRVRWFDSGRGHPSA